MRRTDTYRWRKSSYSAGNGGNCVEVGQAPWRKSSFSGDNGGNCVEVGGRGSRVLVRDTKDRSGPALALTPAAWRGFTARLKADVAR